MSRAEFKRSSSLEILVSQDVINAHGLKNKLREIIQAGKDFECDILSCLKQLVTHGDEDIVLLSIQALSELTKCEEKREMYAHKDLVQPILNILRGDITPDKEPLVKQCCRALGNLCCDCDKARKIILDCNGIAVMGYLLDKCLEFSMDEIKLLAMKAILNYSIGGQPFTGAMIDSGLIDILRKILSVELYKQESDDEIISTALILLGVINDSTTDFMFEEDVNKVVLDILRETTNVEISELSLDHFHSQTEHDSVKLLMAREGGLQLVCTRLEEFMRRHDSGDLNAEDTEVESIIKQACDLIIIVLTGDEAMHILYNNGVGEVYITMIRWLDSPNHHLLTTAILALGNFARKDEYCTQMMDDRIYDKLLDIFEVYHGFAVRMNKEPNITHLIEITTVTKIQHAVLSALRNLTIPTANKRVVAAKGRAAPILLRALPLINDPHVAYKLLAAIRMLVDGQESVAKQLANNPEALASVARWGLCGESTGAAGEAPRLLAWAIKLLTRGDTYWRNILQVEGCISSLVYMLVASHSLMQNEAILSLTLLAIESLKKASPDPDRDYEKLFISQLLKAEIGKHVAVLVDTNCSKMPVEVAENLVAFLDITSQKHQLVLDYKASKVHDLLKKFSDSRSDLSDDLKTCISAVIATISDNVKDN